MDREKALLELERRIGKARFLRLIRFNVEDRFRLSVGHAHLPLTRAYSTVQTGLQQG